MRIVKAFKENIIQINAIVVKNVKLSLRYKLPLILSFITPIIGIIVPLVIMGKLFTFSDSFGPWNDTNFSVFVFVATHLNITVQVMGAFPGQLRTEKYWQTLPALLIAPFKRINLLIGIFESYFVFHSITLIIFIMVCYVFYPISFLTFISILFIYFLVAIAFSGVGLFLGVLAISRENLVPIIRLAIVILFTFSCLGMPFQFFPSNYQNIVKWNPLFYIIDLARLVWIEDNIFYSIAAHPLNVLILVASACIIPILGYYLFDSIFKKYGIVGY